MTEPIILMCPPDHYGIEYEINPWMSTAIQSDVTLAREQWLALRKLIESLGARVELQPPVPGLPDLVFTANAALIWRQTAFVAQFRHPARQGETAKDREWFEAHGFDVVDLPAGMSFEGAGDALFCGETLFGGYFIRSEARAMQWIAKEIGCPAVPVELVDARYYHLDTCFCPLAPEEAIYYPPAFDSYGCDALREHVENLIPVADEEAARFGCNAVVIGKHVIVNTGCPQLEQHLADRGYIPHHTDLGEFIKSGGSAKCLTLRLDGEEAAIWP